MSELGQALAARARAGTPRELLIGKGGALRETGVRLMNADTDADALDAYWEVLSKKSPQTVRAYRREIMRFLLWAVVVQKKSVSDLLFEDYQAYVSFLSDPPEDAIAKPKPGTRKNPERSAERGSKDYRPFRGPVSINSQLYALGVISSMLDWLVAKRHLVANPIPKPQELVGKPVLKPKEDKSIPEKAWEAIRLLMERRCHAPGLRERRAAYRERAIVSMAFGLAMRRADFPNCLANSIRWDRIDKDVDGWVWHAVRKGGTVTKIPVQQWVMDAWGNYRVELGLRRYPQITDDGPLIPSLRTDSSITGQRVYEVVKSVCLAAADDLRACPDRTPEVDAAEAMLRKVSPHWLRHSALSKMLREGASLGAVRDYAGHTDISTTNTYIHSDLAERGRAGSLLKSPV